MRSLPPTTLSRFAMLVIAVFGFAATAGAQPKGVALPHETLATPDSISREVTVLLGPNQPNVTNPPPGELRFPFAVDFDQQGNMVIAEYTGGRVLRQHEGELEVIAGIGKPGYAGDGGPATTAAFHDLHNLAITDGGEIYLSDHENHSVRKIDSTTGVITSFAGDGTAGFSGDGGPASDARLNQVMCVTLTPDKQSLLVTDLKNRRIRSIDLTTKIIATIAGNGKKGIPRDGSIARESPLIDPRAAAMDKHGNLYIVERGGNALRMVDPSGKIFTVAGSGRKGKDDGPALAATMWGPKHLAIDKSNNVYIADDMNHLIRKYDPTTRTLTTVLGDKKWILNRPHGVTVHDGDLFVADSWNHRILRLSIGNSR